MQDINIKLDAMEALHAVRVLESAANRHDEQARSYETKNSHPLTAGDDDLTHAEIERDQAEILRGSVLSIKSAMWKSGVAVDATYYFPVRVTDEDIDDL